MADFPTTIYEPRTKENRSAVVYDPTQTKRIYAEDISKLDAEVVSIENVIGISPLQAFASISDFLYSLYVLGSDFIGSTGFSNPADSTTYYAGMSGWAGSTSQGYYNFNVQAERAVIKNVTVRIGRSGTTPSNEKVAIYLRVNTTDYLISDQVDLSVSVLQSFELNDQDIALEYGDVVCIKIVTPAWATNPVTVVFQTFIHMQALPG
jgi:hypothetical protein